MIMGRAMCSYKETADTGKVITDGYIRKHARILKQLGGKESVNKYVELLTPYRNNNLKFDREFCNLRESIFKSYK